MGTVAWAWKRPGAQTYNGRHRRATGLAACFRVLRVVLLQYCVSVCNRTHGARDGDFEKAETIWLRYHALHYSCFFGARCLRLRFAFST